ncbi:4-amino-4-deoxychorismate lyase [Crossiella equi]|uniref:4-amino-4-deoxychorismate lyase n=1 Tax=Crossiella equi TaxID=130796 RepID=A0ABS5AGZ8_9PSEU|nr:aminodeoxychorismate lyase [Crossiella equi]MBP2475848.1 4-amino-4-deoxychorismate lyase [Crossiella equi]
MRVLALLDGTILDPDTPMLRADDLGMLRGDGVFETVLVVNGVPRELGPHLDRLARSAHMLELPEPSTEQWEHATKAVIDAWDWAAKPEMALKLVYSRGPEFGEGTTSYAMGLEIGQKVVQRRTDGVAALTLARGFDPAEAERSPWLLLGSKSLSYAVNMAAIRYAEANGADEVVFTASDGSVLEGPTANVVVANGRTLRTTPPVIGILPGTTQAALFRAAEKAGWQTVIEPIQAEELLTADGVWFLSSVRRVTQVRSIDGKAIAASPELHAELTDLYESNYR